MNIRVILLASLLALAACQSDQVSRDFDPGRDYSRYHFWSWMQPAVRYQPDDPRTASDLTGQRLRQAVENGLALHGLEPAGTSHPASLQVQVWYSIEQRQRQTSSYYGGWGGGWWGSPWGGYWGGPVYDDVQTYTYQVAIVQIDLHDRTDGKLVWRGSSEYELQKGLVSPVERAAQISRTVREILAHYPTD